MKKSIILVVQGQLYSKSNSRIFTYSRGKPRLFKNQTVLKYVEDAKQQLIPQLKKHTVFENNVCFKADVYYKTKLSDLDVSLMMDILQQEVDKTHNIVLFKGVYLNDRQIVEIHIKKFHDKENPRIEMEISEF